MWHGVGSSRNGITPQFMSCDGWFVEPQHWETNVIILPHIVAYNEPLVGDCLAPIAKLLDYISASHGLWEFANS